MFLDEDLNVLMADYQVEQARLASQFRLHCAEWPDDPDIDAVLDGLRRSSARFADLWDGRDVAPFVSTRRLFDHPRAGRLELDHHRLAVLDQPGMQLVVYTSAAGTDSVRRLQDA